MHADSASSTKTIFLLFYVRAERLLFTVIPILILVAFSALFSSTETAFACVNKIRLKHMADSGDKRAVHALDIANRYEQALTAILVGNNVVNIGASSLATIFFTEHFGSAGAAISTIVMTILVLTFGAVSYTHLTLPTKLEV